VVHTGDHPIRVDEDNRIDEHGSAAVATAALVIFVHPVVGLMGV
jgi:hypothetical protein